MYILALAGLKSTQFALNFSSKNSFYFPMLMLTKWLFICPDRVTKHSTYLYKLITNIQ